MNDSVYMRAAGARLGTCPKCKKPLATESRLNVVKTLKEVKARYHCSHCDTVSTFVLDKSTMEVKYADYPVD